MDGLRAPMDGRRRNVGERRSSIIIGISVVLAVGLVLAWAFSPSGKDSGAQPLTEVTDTATIQSLVQLSRLSIATSENYVGHRLRVITGRLKNVSADKAIRMIEVKMVFTDTGGNSVHDYAGVVFEPTQKPLDPGIEYRFEVSFENLPRNWNYRVPVTEISKIGY